MTRSTARAKAILDRTSHGRLAAFPHVCYNSGNRPSCNRDGGNPVSRRDLRSAVDGREPQHVIETDSPVTKVRSPIRSTSSNVILPRCRRPAYVNQTGYSFPIRSRIFTPSVSATIFSVWIVTLLSPRSISPTCARLSPERSAKTSCDQLRLRRNPRMVAPISF